MCRTFVCAAAMLSLFLGAAVCHAAEVSPEEERWGKAIRAFEEEDKEAPPAKGAVLFLGSSSIRMWDLKESFPDLDALNRGFGGSTIADSLYFIDRIVIPYEPRLIVFYAGDNDIAGGKTPQTVLEDYQAFIAAARKALPKTKVVFVAIKPSIARWKLVAKMREANALIQGFSEDDALLEYVDVDAPMIGEDGRPREGLFLKDGLHLNKEGYALWTSLVEPHLESKGKEKRRVE